MDSRHISIRRKAKVASKQLSYLVFQVMAVWCRAAVETAQHVLLEAAKYGASEIPVPFEYRMETL